MIDHPGLQQAVLILALALIGGLSVVASIGIFAQLRAAGRFARRLYRAWRYFTKLRYSWHLAWIKSAWIKSDEITWGRRL